MNALIRGLVLSAIAFALVADTASAATSAAKPPLKVNMPYACSEQSNLVEVSLGSTSSVVSEKSPLQISGSVKNGFDAPLMDATLVVRVKKIAEKAGGVYERSSDIVDRAIVFEKESVAAGASKDFSFEWKPSAGIASGTYEADFFLSSSDQFVVAGGESADKTFAAQTVFMVRGQAKASTFIDQTSATVNGRPLISGGFIGVDKGMGANVLLNALTTYASSRPVTVEWKLYSSPIISEANLIETKADKAIVAPNKKNPIAYSIPKATLPSYTLVAKLSDGSKSSVYSFRIINTGELGVAMTKLMLASFPIGARQENEVIACVNSNFIGESIPERTISLKLLKEDGSLLANLGTVKSSYALASVGRKFALGVDSPKSVTLRAEIMNGSTTESVSTVTYSCDKVACASNPFAFLMTKAAAWIAGGLVALIVLALSFRRKKGTASPNTI